MLQSPKHTQKRRSRQQETVSLFIFLHVEKYQILKEILCLDSAKASQDTDITTKIIKDNADIFLDFLLPGFNNSITTSIFSSSLKPAITILVFKKADKDLKENYRPVNILPNVSEIYERLLFKQIFLTSWTFLLKTTV